MTAETATDLGDGAAQASAAAPRAYGVHVFGLGVIALGVLGLALRGFPAGQVHGPLGMASAVFLLVAGAALQWRRTAMWAAGAVGAYFAIVVLGLIGAPVAVRHYREFLAYFGVAEPAAIAAGALTVFAMTAPVSEANAQRLAHGARIVFGLCAIFFGAAHFVHMELTAPLVPRWLPPSGEFWGYLTGLCHIAGGLALLSGVQARLAAILLTVMYGSFTPLVHLPMFFANMHSHRNWAENAANLALTGAAWVIADSLARRRTKGV